MVELPASARAIVFLQAELNADPETAWFTPYDPDEPGQSTGFYDIDVEGLDRPVCVFGLQWRGVKTGQALQQVANRIQETNEMHGEPAWTMLLAHFGMEDEVPTVDAAPWCWLRYPRIMGPTQSGRSSETPPCTPKRSSSSCCSSPRSTGSGVPAIVPRHRLPPRAQSAPGELR